ncbi:MAG: Rpn family recombination-promoting nuclease/putative transposase [Prevotellaceae bacterium]|jgi:predicted transposase/invertase (TIGR01784 family)|nr:Rpn family recombination-promoting nuclease/putative transposase [Prevotellaceae bacterium]
MAKKDNYIRFDWAIKRLLCNKADFVVVNGFLSSLLGEPVSIIHVLESEGNKASKEDKFNRTDILVEDSKKRKIIIEIQNYSEFDFFHRMLYGVSKVVTEYLTSGKKYMEIGKIYSVNIMYSSIGQGKGYSYHGWMDFRNMCDQDDILQLSDEQLKKFKENQIDYQNIFNIFPEYFVLKVNKFDDVATTPLAEWMYFLKNSEIPANFTAPGLDVAREKLRVDNLSPKEHAAYDHHLKTARYEDSSMETGEIAGEARGKAEVVHKLYTSLGMPIEQIMQATDFSREKIIEILKNGGVWQEHDK